MKICKYKITGMHCASCGAIIDLDLEEVKGVHKAVTDFSKSETVVECEDTISEDDVVKSIQKSGYQSVKLE